MGAMGRVTLSLAIIIVLPSASASDAAAAAVDAHGDVFARHHGAVDVDDNSVANHNEDQIMRLSQEQVTANVGVSGTRHGKDQGPENSDGHHSVKMADEHARTIELAESTHTGPMLLKDTGCGINTPHGDCEASCCQFNNVYTIEQHHWNDKCDDTSLPCSGCPRCCTDKASPWLQQFLNETLACPALKNICLECEKAWWKQNRYCAKSCHRAGCGYKYTNDVCATEPLSKSPSTGVTDPFAQSPSTPACAGDWTTDERPCESSLCCADVVTNWQTKCTWDECVGCDKCVAPDGVHTPVQADGQ